MINVRLPAAMAADIEAESRKRGVSKSDVVRERIERGSGQQNTSAFDLVADLIGTIDGLPADLSAREKYYLKKTGYGKARTADYGKSRR